MAPKGICYDFQKGKCQRGDACRFLHPGDTDVKRKPCVQFSKGKCTYGKNCKFSHEKADIEELKSAAATTQSTTEAKFKEWRYCFPKDPSRYRMLGAAMGQFWQDAFELVDGDIGLMQDVLKLLAGEAGMKIIAELLDQPLEGLTDSQLTRVFTARLLPFFKTITHANVLSSALSEDRVMTIYNYIFGPGGHRGVKLFQATARHLSSLSLVSKDGSKTADENGIFAFDASIATLSKLVEVNTTAQVHEGFRPVVETLSALLGDTPETFATRNVVRQLKRVQQRFGLGQELPSATGEKQVAGVRTTFHLARDLPGELSEDGPRHDNDKVDIREISILPTQQEIQSSRTEYLPLADPTQWHFGGLDGLLDRNFRLLREDTIGQLRDAAKFEMERLQQQNNRADYHNRKPQGARTHVYDNVTLQNMAFDPFRGLEFAFSFDQPRHLGNQSKKARQDWWEGSKRLGPDALICILSSQGSVTFFVVAGDLPQDHKKDGDNADVVRLHQEHKLCTDTHRAHVIARLVNEEDMQPVLQSMTTGEAKLSLVEFPGVLLPAFMPTLKAMQRLSGTGEVPFAEILAPVATAENPDRDIEIGPPRYATRPGFEIDLSAITHERYPLRFTPGSNVPNAANELQQNSNLDAAQAEALVSSLSRKLVLIQGPPGTGKSYTGVAIIRALLANESRGKLGPILCVTFTNHALDQGLERLLDEGVTQLVRIGGRSKSDRLANLNLRTIARDIDPTKIEKSDRWGGVEKMKEEASQINQILGRLRNLGSWKNVRYHLEKYHRTHAAELFCGQDSDGWQDANHQHNQALAKWLRSGERGDRSVKPIEELHEMHLHSLNARERDVLYKSWLADIKQEFLQRLAIVTESHKEAKGNFDRIRTDIDLRALRQAKIIGVTTSGLARNLDLLQRINVKALVCEEAGEVLEAHLLTALLPSVEHAILIGDHEQLRPHVQNYDLSVEKRGGGHYDLDISLFERLVRPNTLLGQPIPYSTLEVQRRMHPSISNLIRQTIYPHLRDADDVKEYPKVYGLKHRLFWLHHENLEDEGAEAHSTSHTNAFECEMVAAMVSHLVKQGVYRSQDIAVITPYLGQLRKLRNRLASNFEIVVNERDAEDLANQGDDGPIAGTLMTTTARVNVAKGTLLEALRIATVDNFQGEEAKVVVVSLVRSNKNNNPGFLRTPNRINVLLSRAQHGMYIIGNANTTRNVPMWAKVIEMFTENGTLGDTLELCCPRHENIPMAVKDPEDFLRLSPEAGCQLPCEKMLTCGHACAAKCHSDLLHSAVYCQNPCTRPKPGCTHNCPLPCGAVCHKECQIVVDGIEVILECGHKKTSLPCYQYQEPAKVVCKTPKTVQVSQCGHEVVVPCYLDVDKGDYKCRAVCGHLLPCGHTCKKACHKCNPRDVEGAITSTDHGKCKQVCNRDYSTCKHRCKSACHGKEPCPLCEAVCDAKCSHSRCNKKCHEPCTPCAEERCSSHCPHSACKMPCAAPCDWMPCNRRCTETLSCGCQCPSVCGEACPSAKFCQNCASDEVKALKADLIMYEAYGEVDLDDDPCIFPECGHVFTLSSMDGFMAMSEHYVLDELTGNITGIKDSAKSFSSDELKSCPECRGSLRNITRYGRIVRRALLDQSTKRLVIWSNHIRRELAERLHTDQEQLLMMKSRALKQDVKLQGSPGKQMSTVQGLRSSERYKPIIKTRNKIQEVANKLKSEEKPYQRVQDLVETVRRQQIKPGIAPFEFDSVELQLQEHVQAATLLIRCDLTILADVIGMHMKTTTLAQKGELVVDFGANRKQCDALIEEASKSSSFCEAAEGEILWAKFAALECGVLVELAVDHGNTVDALKTAATEKLRFAEETLGKLRHPSAQVDAADIMNEVVAGLVDEINEVQKMLKEGTSAMEMKMVFKAMAAEFHGSTGHWYRCAHGHLFTVGECGMPMERARCPTCGAPIGGESHQAVEGVTLARDIDARFRNLNLNA